MPETIEVLVDGGKASAGPPLGPALGPTGIDIGKVIGAINEKTMDFAGMKVPVKVIINAEKKSFDITVGTPPMSALIKKELGLEKGSQNPGSDFPADLSIEAAIKIARMKEDSLTGKEMRERLLTVIGSCVSMGITVGGENPKDAAESVMNGKYDSIIKKQ